MLTEHPVDEMPLPQAHEVTASPLEQLALKVTVDPGATGVELVLGDWEMLQLLGTEPTPPTPMYTVVLNVAPEPKELDGVTLYDVVTPGATVRDVPKTPMFQLYVIGVPPVVHKAVSPTCVPAARPFPNDDEGTAVTVQFPGVFEGGGGTPLLQLKELSLGLKPRVWPLGQDCAVQVTVTGLF